MKSDWVTAKLSEVAEFNPREKISVGSVAKKVSMDKLQPFCRDIPGFEMSVYTGGAKFRNGDTIMARITPCLENGKVSKVNILSDGEVGFGSTEYIVFRAKDSIADPDYLYYLVCSPLVRGPAIKSMVGSSGRQRVQTDVLQALTVDLPPLTEQREIGAILRSFDDKIALNTRINDNLQQQADAIFSENFLSQELLPVGWRKSCLSTIANYLNGLAMQKYRPVQGENGLPVLKIKELRQGMTDDNSEHCSSNIKPEYIVHDGDIIFSWSGSLLVDFWCGGDCGLNQHLFKVTSTQFDKWFVYAWTKHYLNHFIAVAADKATTMGHIKRDELDKAEVIIPSSGDYMEIGALMQPLYDEIISNRIESRKLSELRDALLPRMMSGELDVSGLDL